MKQLTAGAREYNWEFEGDFKRKVQIRARLAGQTVLVEETIGDMKNRELTRRTSLFRRPETCYFLSLHRGALSERSDWSTPPFDTPLGSKSSRWLSCAFEVERKNRSLPFDEIASTKQKTEYPSPGSSGLTN